MMNISLTFFILAVTAACVNAAGYFDVKLVSVDNPNGLLASGRCCSHESNSGSSNADTSCSSCETVFHVCLLPYLKHEDLSTLGDYPYCNYGEDSSNHVLGINSFQLSESDTSLITIPFNFTWPGSATLLIRLMHRQRNDQREELIMKMVRPIELNAWTPTNWTILQSQTSHSGHSSVDFKVGVRIRCGEFYYGPFCNVSCIPDDGPVLHYTCDPVDGQKRCVDGWEDAGRRCRKARCPSYCERCDSPDICSKCPNGWRGKYCNECIPYPGCLHGSCKQPNECNCEPRWGGHLCNEDMDYCYHKKPCRNGATCYPHSPNNYTCECPPGFVGRDCEIEDNPCWNNPCLNFGTCVVKSKFDYICVCGRMHTGEKCEKLLAGHGSKDPCLVSDHYYEHGQQWEMPGCRQCQCVDGSVNCSQIHCQTDDCTLPRNPCPEGHHCSPKEADGWSCLRAPCPSRSRGFCFPNDFDEFRAMARLKLCNGPDSVQCSNLTVAVNISALPEGIFVDQICYHLMVHVFERRFSQYYAICTKDQNISGLIRIRVVALKDNWPASDFKNVLEKAFRDNRRVLSSPVLRALVAVGDERIFGNDSRNTTSTPESSPGDHGIIAGIVAIGAGICILAVAAYVLWRRIRSPDLHKSIPDTEKMPTSNIVDVRLNNWADQRWKQCNILAAASCKRTAQNESILDSSKEFQWKWIREKQPDLVVDTKGRSSMHMVCRNLENGSNIAQSAAAEPVVKSYAFSKADLVALKEASV